MSDGSKLCYRIREGDDRVAYTVAASTLVLEVIRVAHLKEVYDP